MQQRLKAIYDKHIVEFSGTCLITRGDEVLFSAASGLANRDFDAPNRLDTRFDVASVTKTLTAVAVLQLVERGLLNLSDSIHDIIDLSGTSIPAEVSVEQLLNHTSGIADDADEEAGEDYAELFINKPNYSIRNCADFLPQFAYKQPNFEPGTDVRYNNCAYVLLGLAIENLTATDYRGYVMEHVFKPAGMVDSFFGAKDEVCTNTAEGYFAVTGAHGAFEKWKKNIYSYPPIGTSDGGALTSAGDLSVFIRALKSGALLSPEYTKMIMAPHCAFTRPHRHGSWRSGYGFEFVESNGKLFCMYKDGVNTGVSAILSYYPGLDITLVLLSNQDGPFWTMYREMQAVLRY